MTRSSFKLAFISTLLLSPCLGGCAVAVIGGMAAAGGAGYEAAQERGLDGKFEDMNIQSRINNALNNQYGNITTTVYRGKVLLTGSSPTPDAKLQAEQIASREQGVKAIFNEIVVGPNAEPWQLAKDTWITTRVRSDLTFDAGVRSGNYTIETDRQSVYLMGSARSQAELDKATQLARYVPDVQRVVSYVEVRYGDPNAVPAQAGLPPPGPRDGVSSSGPSSYGSRPSTPSSNAIQVQKL